MYPLDSPQGVDSGRAFIDDDCPLRLPAHSTAAIPLGAQYGRSADGRCASEAGFGLLRESECDWEATFAYPTGGKGGVDLAKSILLDCLEWVPANVKKSL